MRSLFENSEGAFIFANARHKETKDVIKRLEIITDVRDRFNAYFYVYVHLDKYILLIKTDKYTDKLVRIFDNYEEFKPIPVYSYDYYLKVVDKEIVNSNYSISIQLGDKILFTAQTANFKDGIENN